MTTFAIMMLFWAVVTVVVTNVFNKTTAVTAVGTYTVLMAVVPMVIH